MIRIKDLIEELQQYDENLEVGVYCGTTSYGSYYLYEDGCTMLVEENNQVMITPSKLPME